MPEVQLHGFDFENWVKNRFFEKFNISYSHKWDIPKEFNSLEIVPAEFRGLPVSVKIVNLSRRSVLATRFVNLKSTKIFY